MTQSDEPDAPESADPFGAPDGPPEPPDADGIAGRDVSAIDGVVTVERVIATEAGAIFDLLADPDRHHDIDGSGTVVEAKAGSQRLALGSTFGMSMKVKVPYSMQSEVIEFEEDRRIAWQTRGPGRVGRHVGGRIWRYELEPAEGGTRVRESWDIREESALTKWMVARGADDARKSMAATLVRIEELLTDES